MMKKTKLSVKFLLPLLTSVILGMVLVIVILMTICGQGITALSTDYSYTLAEKYAQQVESKLAITLNTAETLSNDIRTVMQLEGVERKDILALAYETLEQHTELVGLGVAFEANTFDGSDRLAIGRSDSDASGRFVPYTFRDGDKISHTLLTGYNDPGSDGLWYSVPKSTNKTYVTAPYWYEVGAEKYLIVSCLAPIKNMDGNFIGVVGFDMLVSSLNDILGEAKVYDTGYLAMAAPDGTIAYHPNADLSSKSLYDVFPQELADAADTVYQTGTAMSVTTKSSTSGARSLNILEPIQVGESGGNWILATNAPLSEINEVINSSIFFALVAGNIVLIIIILLLLRMVRRIILKPVLQISTAAGELSRGNLSFEISYQSEDELGQLAKNLQSTGNQLSIYVGNISETLGKMSQGDFTMSADMDYIGDLKPIQISMNQIIDRMGTTLSNIRNTADQVASGSEQVAAGAQALSQGATEQASSVQELAATISEISNNIRESSEHAQQASRHVDEVGDEMLDSNQKMQQMIEAMQRISDSSDEIKKIIKTIEDIAFQTNILALNAAVEAARAGAAGKGFAVVADEVRNLANKSQEASKNTASLIETSLKAVEQGTQIANNTAQSLVISVKGAKEITEAVDKISEGSMQQSNSIIQVTLGIDQISSVVQMNSATAEQSSATSEELSGQAQMLKRLVDGFQLKETVDYADRT